MKHLFASLLKWELIPLNPAQGIKTSKPPVGRVRYLQTTELRGILASAPEWLRPIIGLAATTGMRGSEILGLRWLDVDLTNRGTMVSTLFANNTYTNQK